MFVSRTITESESNEVLLIPFTIFKTLEKSSKSFFPAPYPIFSIFNEDFYNDFQDMSIKFSKYVQVMTPKMQSVVNDLHNAGIKCGVALFGETIFTIIPSNMERKVLDILKKYNDGIIIKSAIDNFGVRLE